MSQRPQVFIIDGASFMYRALYALKPMHSPQGLSVGTVYGFCRILRKLIQAWSPAYILIAWDSRGKTERHAILPEYKGSREAPPQELIDQKELIKEFADIVGICQIALPGIEADDIMYSIALDVVAQGFDVVIVTNDKDLGQTVNDHIVLYDAFKEIFINREVIIEKYGIPPEKLPFYFGIVGDTSDDIPGVKGIGPKGAQKIVPHFDSMEELYQNLDRVSDEKLRKKLQEQQHNARISEQLFRLIRHEIPLDITQCSFKLQQWSDARNFFIELGFSSLLKDMQEQEPKFFSFSQRYGVTFTTITSEDLLKQVCHEIQEHGSCAVDTEMTGIHALQSKLVGVSLAYKIGQAYYIPIAHHGGGNVASHLIATYLKPLLENSSVAKYLQNAKFDALVFAHHGITLQGVVFDTMIAAHLLAHEDERVNLKYLSQRYLQQEMVSFPNLLAYYQVTSIAHVPIEAAQEYAAADAHQTLQLTEIFQKKLAEEKFDGIFNDIEMPVMKILTDMEREGIIIDTSRLLEINARVVRDLDVLKQDMINLVGPHAETINFNSSHQIEKLLFEDLKLSPIKKTSGKSRYSTDREVLLELAQQHPVPALIIKYRELYKLKSTYLDALPNFVNSITGRIHTNFSQISTATGRLASSEPNLQNIPVEPHEEMSVRSAFKAPPGHVFLSADYSQIELRVLAYLSQDKQLIDAFQHEKDIHAITASRLFDVSLDRVTHEQRQLGKRINFSILYGLTPYGLSKDLHIPFADAKLYIEKYREQYPGVYAWMESVIEETRHYGYVTTYFGRRRYISGIHERNKHLYELACRVAINTKAQGTAAEIVKQGMMCVLKALADTYPAAKMILQIHDELLISVPHEQHQEVEKIVRKSLENVVDWNVPLRISMRIGHTWGAVTK
jgi:DNA polymerase-1